MRGSLVGIAVLVGCLAQSQMAQAGGLSRGSADFDILYGDTAFGIYTGGTYVAPGRSYSRASGLVISGGAPTPFTQSNISISENYFVPSVSIGGRIYGDLRCAGTYTQPYGADAKYSGAISYHIAEQTLTTNEYGLTCGYGFNVGKGRLSVFGGGFYETISLGQSRNFTAAFGLPGDSRVDLSSSAWGYRLGLGYEIPEIALKAQLMYRSQTNHNATGAYSNTPFALLAIAAGMPADIARAIYGDATSASATASASLPQSLEMRLQSGIAPNWLAFGSVKWTDWSVLRDLQVNEGIGGRRFSTTNFFFNDGWTVTGGVGHRFNKKFGGTLSLTWDKGVTSGWDVLTDTWTVAAGAAYDVNEKFQISGGGAAIYFTEGRKSQTSSAVDYTATAPGEWGFAFSLAGRLKF